MDAGVKTKKPGHSVGARPQGRAQRANRHQVGRHHRRRPDGQRHRPCGGAGGLRAWRCSTCKKETIDKARSTIERNMARQVSRGIITDAEMQGALKRIRIAADLRRHRRGGPRDRGGHRGRGREAQDLHRPLSQAEEERDPRHQHLVDLHHPAGVRHRPARALHRHPLHEPGADDAAGRADPRHRHRGRDLRRSPAASSRASARPSRCRRTSRPSSSTASCCR